MLTLLLSLLAVYATAQNSVTVMNCDTNSVFKMVDVSVSPSVPVKNENITVHTIYSVPAEVTKGVASYSCTFNGIPFSPTVDDLCTQTSCPISVGNHDEYSSVMVPQIGGKIVCDMKWMNVDQSVSYLCLRTTLKLSAGLRGKACSMNMTKFISNATEPLPYETEMGVVPYTSYNIMEYEPMFTYNHSAIGKSVVPFSLLKAKRSEVSLPYNKSDEVNSKALVNVE